MKRYLWLVLAPWFVAVSTWQYEFKSPKDEPNQDAEVRLQVVTNGPVELPCQHDFEYCRRIAARLNQHQHLPPTGRPMPPLMHKEPPECEVNAGCTQEWEKSEENR